MGVTAKPQFSCGENAKRNLKSFEKITENEKPGTFIDFAAITLK